MANRKRGTLVNFAEPMRRGVRVAHHKTAHISTSYVDSISHGVLTNGNIVSVSDTVTIPRQTVPTEDGPSPK